MSESEIRLRCLEIAASMDANYFLDTDELLVEAECMYLFVTTSPDDEFVE